MIGKLRSSKPATSPSPPFRRMSVKNPSPSISMSLQKEKKNTNKKNTIYNNWVRVAFSFSLSQGP